MFIRQIVEEDPDAPEQDKKKGKAVATGMEHLLK